MLRAMFLWSCLVVPWLTLFAMDKKLVRRYLPAALFITLINTIIDQLASYYQWWIVKDQLFLWSKLDIPIIYGLFIVGSMWILRFTYGKFLWFLVVNAAVDAFQAFIAAPVFHNTGFISFGNMSQADIFLLMFGFSFILYGFQMWYEGESPELLIGRRSKERT
jgi:hypothetical protein